MEEPSEYPIRIVIIDHYCLVRAGIRLMIEAQPGMKIVGETGDFNEGLKLGASLKPDIFLLEILLDGDPCIEIISKLQEISSQARVILVTNAYSSQVYLQAMQMGVMGIVSKAQKPEVLIKAIQKVYAGEVWIERSMMAHLLTSISRIPKPSETDIEAQRFALLSSRERQIVVLISQGLRNKQIAAQLCISETTVRHHLTSIFSKLQVLDRLELLVLAHRCCLTKMPEQ